MSGYMKKSKSDKWGTPKDVYDKLNEEFKFDFDPCPVDWKDGDDDGLTIEWGESNFVNPPYSQVSKWIEKGYKEWKKGKNVVMLINAITDTKAFHKYIYNNAEIRFIEGRLKFINLEEPTKKLSPNVRASMIVIFKN
jgi:phage N-6-adenine-methyltransferase